MAIHPRNVWRLVNSRELRENVKTKLDKLKKMTTDLEKKINELKFLWIGSMTRAEYEEWVDQTKMIKNETQEVEKTYQKYEGEKHLLGFFPRVSKLEKLNKSIETVTDKVQKLEEETPEVSPKIDDPRVAPSLMAIISKNPTILKKVFEVERGDLLEISPEGDETLPVLKISEKTSTLRTLHDIVVCLTDQNKHSIGIYGQGGIGKTTMMRILSTLPETTQTFSIVIWVSVSRSWSYRKVQDEIAERLSLKVTPDESDDRVAMRLFHHLAGMKFLLLLDDVWEEIDLNKLGIPHVKRNSSKVVLTSRSSEVCVKMETEENFEVQPKAEEESWEFFKEVNGILSNNEQVSEEILTLAKQVTEACKGLPLAIEVIGRALKGENDVSVWKDAFNMLSSSAGEDEFDSSPALKALKFSYGRLKEENERSCFMYASLYPEGHEIRLGELIEHWVLEGFTGKVKTMAESYKAARTTANRLIDAGLLQRSSREGNVKMHDLHRDMALKIVANQYLVKAGSGLPKAPEEKKWESTERISLMHNELKSLPKSPNCQDLLTLLLQDNQQLRVIPEQFFKQMVHLRVLNLSSTRINALPPSIFNLTSLRGLLLKNCERLASLPPEVEHLIKLEVLDLRGTRINCLPEQIKKLTRLRSLQASFHGYINNDKQIIPYEMISDLHLLEELQISVQPDDTRWNNVVDAVTEELSRSENLTSIDFYFPTAKQCEQFTSRSKPWKEGNVNKFRFTVGLRVWRLVSRITGFGHRADLWNRHLRFTNEDGVVPDAVTEVLRHADAFHLDGHKTIKKLSEFGLQNLSGLKGCLVGECEELETLVANDDVDAMQCEEEAVFRKLEYLSLQYLSKLKIIWQGPKIGRSFKHLKTLIVGGCPELETIFSEEMIANLICLEELRVFSCPKVKNIIVENSRTAILEKLTFLVLFSLPELQTICEKVTEWVSLQVMYISNCPKLKKLPRSRSQTVRIIGKQEWWENLKDKDNTNDKPKQIFLPV